MYNLLETIFAKNGVCVKMIGTICRVFGLACGTLMSKPMVFEDSIQLFEVKEYTWNGVPQKQCSFV